MKAIHKLTLKPIVIALSLLQSSALTHAAIGLASGAPWTNRFTGQGLTGDHQLGGFVDDMLPILGSADSLFYLDGTFAAAQQDAWLAGPGTGIRLLRSIGDRQIIAGAFVFGEYEHTPNDASAWYANPGFELMTNHQEFRIQGYLPLTKRVKGYDTVQASQLSQTILNDTKRDQLQFAFASGHSLYDTSVELADSFGTGLDVEAGQYLPVGLGGWLRAGFYHFDYENSSSINGVEANLQLFTGKHASLILQDNYDNQNKNKFMIGVQMTLGGPDYTQVQDLSNRMEEPIIRHIATPTYALITPIRHDYIPTGSTIPIATGNWFFSRTTGTSQGGTISFANCTAENPCFDLTQDIADGIQLVQPAATLMFATGDYPLETNTSGQISGNPQAVIMSDGQTVIGRTGASATLAQWSQIATGSNRPEIDGALFWGNNHNGSSPTNASGTIENMQMINSNQLIPKSVSGYDPAGSTTAAVIAVGATNNLVISNSVLSATSTANDAQALGLWSFNGTLTASKTNITARTNGQGVINTDNYDAIGILGQNGQVSFSDGTITTSTTGDYALSYGAFVGTSDVVITNSTINASTSGANAHSSGVFAALTSSNATVTSSSVTASATGTQSTATGVSAVFGDAHVTNSQISATTSGANGVAYGVHVSNTGHTATISGSTINSASTNTNSLAYGIGSDIVTFIGSASSTTATAQASGALAGAIQGASTVNNPNNSKCTTNGNTVTCHV